MQARSADLADEYCSWTVFLSLTIVAIGYGAVRVNIIPFGALQVSNNCSKIYLLLNYQLAFPADIGRKPASPAPLTCWLELVLPATLTRRLMKRPTVQHGGARKKCFRYA